MLRRPGRVLAVAAVVVGLVACTPAVSAGPSAPEPLASRDVGVQLFQWTWDAIAAECPALADVGYGWVLTSPPQEHILGEAWWTSYQPVSYRIDSRLGSRDQFAAMTEACADAGVGIVADAVVNHMTGQDVPGVGWAGSRYDHFDYPGLWSDVEGHFHHCGLTPNDDIASYSSAVQVRTCELVNLADLATESEPVRARLREYLADLASLGVAGVRIDAAKHMTSADVEAITAELPEGFLVISEVIRGPQEPIRPEEYTDAGDVLEFAWGRDVAGIVKGGALRLALELGSEEGSTTYLPSEAAWIFVDNHDTERGRQTLSYADAQDYALATALMLASGYGRPVVYSGYAFSDRDAGPVQDADGAVLDAVC
ncbi:MAG: alpha-amylase family glycosyl hydrolase, partial [Actinomycetota bacterium]|nr:alpha-amylase family glycosyl hydrolase [Actinomycetota bacterium]